MRIVVSISMSSGTSTSNIASPLQADKMDESLSLMIQDANGSDVFSNTKTLMGFIEAGKFLVLPEDFFNECKNATVMDVDISLLGKKDGIQNYLGTAGAAYRARNAFHTDIASLDTEEKKKLMVAKISTMNYLALKNAGVDEVSAVYAAQLRAHWSITGAVLALSHDTAGLANEYYLVNDTDPIYGPFVSAKTAMDAVNALGSDATKFIEVTTDKDYGAKWVVGYAQNIWCAVEHVFRVRSHHFKDTGKESKSYEEIYARFMNACYSGSSTWPSNLDQFAIYHTAIHPFRIRALPMVAAHFVAYDLVADAAIVRMSGAPCGNAVITTTHAALKTMASEAWYNAFSTIYSDKVAILGSAVDTIMDNKYAYHIAAALYGFTQKVTIDHNGVEYTISDVKGKTEMLAAAGHGLITALQQATEMRLISSFALSNSKALEKPAASNPMLSMKVNQIIVASIEDISKATSSSTALAVLLPQLTM